MVRLVKFLYVASSIASVVLLCALLWGWYDFAPATSGVGFDFYGSQDLWMDSTRLTYYVILVPISVLGILSGSLVFAFSFSGDKRSYYVNRTIGITLVIFAITTLVEPLFLEARKVFSPLVNLQLDRKFYHEMGAPL